jgi:ELWxxDGT repeat protein
MKKNLLSSFLLSVFILPVSAQVTRLSNNTSYDWGFALTNTKIMLRSGIDKTILAYDIPGNSFTQLSSTVSVEADYQFGVLNGKLYFAGKTAAEGIELWVSDGTPGGTSLLKDINTNGTADSNPKYGFIVYNNELYFTADDGSTGRELWKTNGTGAGTIQVKDINTGLPDAFSGTTPSNFKVINNILVFSATTAADGDELWKTDGTGPGTTQLKNIYTTAGLGSHISGFTEYGSNLIFVAFDEVNGDAIWKTDGTTGGTSLIKDINPDPPLPPPFYFLLPSVIPGFFNFQNELYFAGNDGTNGFELWKTDGTGPGTQFVKDIDPGPGDGFPLVALSVKNSNKFFFSATTTNEGTELWESDGTGPGTQLLKDIAPGATSSDAIVLPDFTTNGLFQGNKFFLIANTPGVEGNEFYISDGTPGGTVLLKDINPGPGDGYDGVNLSWYYTNNKFYFVANDGTNGSELWQSDGTGPGTALVANINATAPGAGSNISFRTVASGTLFFFGTDGDDAVNTDFFKLDASVALPLLWVSVEARPSNNDVWLLWETAAEEQTDYFVIQRSADGITYQDIGKVNAHGGVSNQYRLIDVGAMKQAGVKKWYYRIKYVDKDTKWALSRIATVALNKSITSILMLPNPVSSELKMLIEAISNDHASMSIVNMEGKNVLQRSVDIHAGQNTVISNLGNLPNGVYLLQIIMGGSATTERFLIQH